MSVSQVKPVLHLLKVNFLNLNDDDTELTNTMKATILDYLTAKYRPLVTCWIWLCLLIQGSKPNTLTATRQGIQARAVSVLESLLTVQAQNPAASAQPQPTSTSTSQSPEAEQTPPKKAKKTLTTFLKTSGAVTVSASRL